MILQREDPLRKGFRLLLVLGVFEMELDEGGDFSFEDIFIDRAKEVIDGARQVIARTLTSAHHSDPADDPIVIPVAKRTAGISTANNRQSIS